jgi:XRE family transcriptional regulator, fatty acid utilization regulator
MNIKGQNNKIIFGLKVRQLRAERNLSFAVLAEQTGMSVSYLNEIEKGKKYPKDDKIALLANALQTTPKELISEDMPKSLAPIEELLQSNFLNELPLDLFGIELNKVVEIIANAPMRVGAFISTLVELGRNYALREENFYFGALRSYLELNDNYFEDLEEAVRQFVKLHKIPTGHALPASYLGGILEKKFGYKIQESGLDVYPELKNIRSLYVPKNKTLLLNKSMTELQKSFQYGKELGFNVLGLKERAYTASLLRVKTFDEALNHFKAGYFSAALLINREAFVKDIEQFLKLEHWDDGVFLNKLMQHYEATPEMLLQRMTNVLPRFFNLQKLFVLRFIHNLKTGAFDINKELHLNRKHHPHGNGLDEHYCRRWISITLLQDFQKGENPKNTDLSRESREGGKPNYMIGIQRSQFHQTNDEYLCITIVHPSGERNVSVTLGILIDNDSKNKIKFLQDSRIIDREVSTTCERCGILDCAERAIEPIVVQRRVQRQKINETLKKILDN